jgi:hypothetical protein
MYEVVHNTNTVEDFSTIQAEIDDPDTRAGHTVMVDPDTYDENVNVYKSLTIRSPSDLSKRFYNQITLRSGTIGPVLQFNSDKYRNVLIGIIGNLHTRNLFFFFKKNLIHELTDSR